MKVSIESRHIINGIRCKARHCALALAIKEALNSNNVIVGHFVVFINDVSYDLKKEAIQFVTDFDNNRAKECEIDVY